MNSKLYDGNQKRQRVALIESPKSFLLILMETDLLSHTKNQNQDDKTETSHWKRFRQAQIRPGGKAPCWSRPCEGYQKRERAHGHCPA